MGAFLSSVEFSRNYPCVCVVGSEFDVQTVVIYQADLRRLRFAFPEFPFTVLGTCPRSSAGSRRTLAIWSWFPPGVSAESFEEIDKNEQVIPKLFKYIL